MQIERGADSDSPNIPPIPPSNRPRISLPDQTRDFLSSVMPPGTCLEMMIFKAQFLSGGFVGASDRFNMTFAGWYDRPDSFVADAGRLKGVSGYLIPNPVDRAFLASSDNKLRKVGKDEAANDSNIIALRWLYLDFDPEKPGREMSSTSEELAATVVKRDRVFLEFPEMREHAMWGCSGNGSWALVRLPDYKNNEEHRDLIRRTVDFFSREYGADKATKNPARLMPLIGTFKCKGSNRIERPWRPATLDSRPINSAGYDLIAWADRTLPKADSGAATQRVMVASPGKNATAAERPGSTPVLESRRPRVSGRNSERPDAESRARAYILSPGFPVSVAGDHGHGVLYRAACILVDGFGLDRNTAITILAEFNREKASPPESEYQIEHKVDSAISNHPSPSLSLLNADQDDRAAGRLTGIAKAAADGRDWEAEGQAAADEASERKYQSSEFRNYEEIQEEDEEPTTEPLRIHDIDHELRAITNDWPKRVGDTLFSQAGDYKPVYLDSSARLFAWIDGQAQVDWKKGNKLITQERFFEHLRMRSPGYEAIETLPHWPRHPKIYYMHRSVPRPSGKLQGLISYFCPYSDEDRELILAFFLTLFWGGPPGARPAFLVTGPDADSGGGRGLGKTKVVDVASALSEGYVDVAPTDAIADVKTRLLSKDARQCRLARLDNLKTHRLSWADLEGLITSTEISGKALYLGEGRRPNVLTWAITLNGASLSKDMAQRVIPIKLKRPQFNATWEHSVFSYIRENKWEILADIGEILECPTEPISPKTRWATWEQEVLSRLDLSSKCQAIIVERQGSIDDDDNERDLVAEYFASKLREYGHNPTTDRVLITSKTAAEWLSEVTRKHYVTNSATVHISGLQISQIVKHNKNICRGWIWSGTESEGSSHVMLGSSAYPATSE